MTGDSPNSTASTLQYAREAGASDLFVMVAALDPEAAEVKHNYVQRKLVQAVSNADGREERVKAIQRLASRSGDFVGNLWEGDLAGALYHADGTNTRLLVRMLSSDLLLSALAEDRRSMESARRWLGPKIDRYGWDGAGIWYPEEAAP